MLCNNIRDMATSPPPETRFCTNCGKTLTSLEQNVCSGCSKPVSSGAATKFCNNCGKPVDPDWKRCPSCGRSPVTAPAGTQKPSLLIPAIGFVIVVIVIIAFLWAPVSGMMCGNTHGLEGTFQVAGYPNSVMTLTKLGDYYEDVRGVQADKGYYTRCGDKIEVNSRYSGKFTLQISQSGNLIDQELGKTWNYMGPI